MNKETLHKPIVHILLIIVICIIAYSNTFSSSFIYDDKFVIVGSGIVKDLHHFIELSDARIFNDNLFEYTTFKRRYIGYLTFALNYKVHGLNVTGYHVVNMFIHMLNAVLIYFFIRISFKTPYVKKSSIKEYSGLIALTSALLFVAHPIQTEAVTYIWQRVTSLTTTFYLFSLIMYIKARLKQQMPESALSDPEAGTGVKLSFYYLLSIVSAVLAMKTKEIAFTLPITIALYESMFFEGSLRKRVLYLVPLFLTMLIIPVSLIDFDKPIGELIGSVGGATRAESEISRLDYLFTEFRVIVTYIRLVLMPVNQNFLYNYPKFSSFIHPEVLLSFLFLLLITGVGAFLWFRFRNTVCHTRLITFGILWFFITLSIESSVFPIRHVIFEHRMYLPSIGVFALLSTVMFMVVEKMKTKWKNVGNVTASFLTIMFIVLTGATYERNKIWKNEKVLWEDVVKKSPEDPVAHNNLGHAYGSGGFYDNAIEAYLTTIALDPLHVTAYKGLCEAYIAKSIWAQAEKKCKTALSLYRNSQKAYKQLGDKYQLQGLKEKAAKQYTHVKKINPVVVTVHLSLGRLYGMTGRAPQAVHHLDEALKLEPENKQARNNLGSAYYMTGRYDEAIGQFRTVLDREPENYNALYNMGLAHRKKGLQKKADEYFSRAEKVKK
ncbi:MAG: tetratricopeptide repeat protein [Nitrospirota bacterium]